MKPRLLTRLLPINSPGCYALLGLIAGDSIAALVLGVIGLMALLE